MHQSHTARRPGGRPPPTGAAARPRRRRRSLPLLPLLALLAATGLAGCSERRETQPDETATHQLLLSTAADNAVDRLQVRFFTGAKVWLDTTNFESYRREYVIGAVRTHLMKQGATLVQGRNDAMFIAELRSGALSINKTSELLGLPSFGLPVPLAGTLKLPEIAVLKRSRQLGVARLSLTVYRNDDGRIVQTAGPAYGLSWRDRWNVLGVGWTKSTLGPPDEDLQNQNGVEKAEEAANIARRGF